MNINIHVNAHAAFYMHTLVHIYAWQQKANMHKNKCIHNTCACVFCAK